MICDSRRRDFDTIRATFWRGAARICRQRFSHWSNPDSDELALGDAASVGIHSLPHGLPSLAAAFAILLLAATSTAYASRHCLDYGEAARTWPARMLVKDGDGCWTYDHRPRRLEVPSSTPEIVLSPREPMLMERWVDADMAQVELRQAEPENVSGDDPQSGPDPSASAVQFALFVSLVLATVSVVEVVTVRHGTSARHRRALGRESRL
ncbi:MAG: hypothetical protein WB768_04475 [Bradyrhizobium sp.]